MGRASFITSTNVCASSPISERIVSPASLLEKMASTRDGSSCGANARLIKRPQAGSWSCENENQWAISVPHKTMKAGLNAYRSRMQRSWWCHIRLLPCSASDLHSLVAATVWRWRWLHRAQGKSEVLGYQSFRRCTGVGEVGSRILGSGDFAMRTLSAFVIEDLAPPHWSISCIYSCS